MKISKPITASIVAVGLIVSGAAQAHGNKDEDAENKVKEPVEKEQTEWGIADDPANATRTVTVAMLDKMRFDPSSVNVKEGETIRFVLENKGEIKHEFVLGTQKSLDEHAAMMIKFPKMEHEQPYMSHVAPSKSGEIVWKFNRGGEFMFACLIPGHYQAGMVGALGVSGMGKGHGHAKEAMKHDDGHADGKKKKHTH